jgi:hypothetical protein
MYEEDCRSIITRTRASNPHVGMNLRFRLAEGLVRISIAPNVLELEQRCTYCVATSSRGGITEGRSDQWSAAGFSLLGRIVERRSLQLRNLVVGPLRIECEGYEYELSGCKRIVGLG